MLDAASFLGLGHTFVEIMTGNLVYLAFILGSAVRHSQDVIGGGAPWPYALALVCFGLGALTGGFLVRWGETGRRLGFVSEWLTLGAAVLLTLTLHPSATSSSRYPLLGVLSAGMGLQNALLRRWGVRDLATNVMTLTMTALVAESRLAGGQSERQGRRFASIMIFFLSAMAGAAMVVVAGTLWPELLALVIFSLALPVLCQASAEDVPRKVATATSDG